MQQQNNKLKKWDLKKGIFIVVIMACFILFFLKFGHFQDILEKEATASVQSQNEVGQSSIMVNDSNNLIETKSDPFIDPDIEPKFIRKATSIIEPIIEPILEPMTEELTEIQKKYPALYTTTASTFENPNHTAYLTFDDGPSPITVKVLDELKSHGIKATFFVVGTQVKMYPEILRRIVSEGHAVGIHTDTHKYENIYANLDSFFNDYDTCFNKIKEITEYPVTVTRFPGGSNSMYNVYVKEQIRSELKRRGFTYYDWNVSSGDANSVGITKEQYVNNILNGITGKNIGVILAHDAPGKTVTADSIGTVIDELAKMGYQFGVLSNKVKPVQFN
ncbi:MAG: putative polysaccharide deacetylase [Bacillales bacterium]|nr:putative polysaccharide deacetylase [Bacillales bacterium]